MKEMDKGYVLQMGAIDLTDAECMLVLEGVVGGE